MSKCTPIKHRKTIAVNQVVDMANEILSVSTCSPDVRQGIINLLEGILHETGNYKGFRYLLEDEVPPGERPGIHYEKDERGIMLPHPNYTERFANTDRTRVQY